MVQGITPYSCGCNNNAGENYIDKWFMYFETNSSFKAHQEQGFISPDSIVFLEETGQLFTNGHFFGVCLADFNALKSVVFNHTKMIQNILGIDGPSIGDGLINTIKDIQDFLNGFTTEDNLKDFINQVKFNLQGSIEDVQLQLTNKSNELTKKVDDALAELTRVENALKARCDLHDSELTTIKSRLSSAEQKLQTVTGEWNEFTANYLNWQTYIEGRLDTLNDSFLTLQQSDNKLHDEINELNARVNRYDSRIEAAVAQVQSCYAAMTELEQKFNDLRQEVSDFYNTKGHANGLCPLNEDGVIDQQYIPLFFDDILEGVTKEDFPTPGEFGKIYVELSTNKIYRWTGTEYIEVSESLRIGEEAGTAYPGHLGKLLAEALANHKADDNNPHKVTKEQLGLGLVDNTPDNSKPVSVPQQNALDNLHTDITTETNVAIEKAINEAKKEVTQDYSDIDQAIKQHKADRSNPHEVTKAQVGLSMVDNTADMDKPVSVPQKVAIDEAKNLAHETHDDLVAHKENHDNPHNVTKLQVGLGNVDNTSDQQKPVSILQKIAIDNVKDLLEAHKEDNANPHKVTKEQVGLDRVDNTSDAEKPISEPTLKALKTQRDELVNLINEIAGEYTKIAALETKFDEILAKMDAMTSEFGQMKEALAWKPQ